MPVVPSKVVLPSDSTGKAIDNTNVTTAAGSTRTQGSLLASESQDVALLTGFAVVWAGLGGVEELGAIQALGMLSVSALGLLAEAADGMAGAGAQPKNGGSDFQDKSDALFGSSIVFATVTATLDENIDTMDADGVAVGRGSAELSEGADSLDAAGVARAASSGSMLEADDVAWMAGRAVPLLPPRRLSLSIAPQGRLGFQLAQRDHHPKWSASWLWRRSWCVLRSAVGRSCASRWRGSWRSGSRTPPTEAFRGGLLKWPLPSPKAMADQPCPDFPKGSKAWREGVRGIPGMAVREAMNLQGARRKKDYVKIASDRGLSPRLAERIRG